MPAKYSHVRKRSASGLLKKSSTAGHIQTVKYSQSHRGQPNPYIDKCLSQAVSAVSQLERTISRILLIRYEQDMARLFSTRLFTVALVHLPTLIMRCITVAGPGWPAYNADCEELKDFFRAAITMDMRQAGERVATKSVLWSYTALRHFAISNNVPICSSRGLHSMSLLPHYPALKAHLDTLESMPPPSFYKPPHLGPLTEGARALEDACKLRYISKHRHDWPANWSTHVRAGYELVTQTLWQVAREFDVGGYGLVLREKLTSTWCECGCSTDHLGEVCEPTVREDEEESGVRRGKQREWDGRGSGILGWETEEEEDLWGLSLDFCGSDDADESEMTIGQLMEWRYVKAEEEKEHGNNAFRKGEFDLAVKHYEAADRIEPEMPHYQLNLAAAHLKLNNWIAAENACTKALGQHRSVKGYFRRAKARKMLGRHGDAIKDLRALLKIQPNNPEAITELSSLLKPRPDMGTGSSNSSFPSDPPKPLPFSRTKMDDKKLRFLFDPKVIGLPKAKKGMTATKIVSYPNWERYEVRSTY